MDKALQYATARWGTRSRIGTFRGVKEIGMMEGNTFYIVGRGDTWEKAIESAKSRPSNCLDYRTIED